jgi:hypothetical protein
MANVLKHVNTHCLYHVLVVSIKYSYKQPLPRFASAVMQNTNCEKSAHHVTAIA